MKTIWKVIICLTAAGFLLGLLTVIQIIPDTLSEDSVLIDDGRMTEAEEQKLYEELFDPDSVVEIQLNASKEQIADMQRDFEYHNRFRAKPTTYRIADSVTITVNGKKYVIQEVGIRMKGTKSRCSFYNDILGIYNLPNLRISFNQLFDDESEYGLETRIWTSDAEREKRLNRTFATMDSLELKWNRSGDNTYVRSGYVQEVFRAYGIPTQQSTLSSVSMSGCKMGIFRVYEPIDKGFIRRYFPEEDWGGDLYKARWADRVIASFRPYSTYGIGEKDKSSFFNFDLKTNIGTSAHESMIHLREVVNNPQVTKEELDSVIDTDWLTLFTAINFAMGNIDDMRSNYNNFYVYFRQSDGKTVFIPYDCELVMGAVASWNPPGNGLTELSPYYTTHFERGMEQDNPFVRQVILEDGYYNDLYNTYLLDVVHSKWFAPAAFEAYYKPFAANYSDKVISKYNYMSTLPMNMDFSLEGGELYNGNMSVAEFMSKMKQNIENYVLPAE